MIVGMPRLPDHTLVVVFDGHGGDQTAAIANERLVGHLEHQPLFQRYAVEAAAAAVAPAPEMLGEALRTAFLELDTELRELLPKAAGESPMRSGSTACAVIVTPSHVVCANIGDSRACFCRVDNTLPAYRAKQLVQKQKEGEQQSVDLPPGEARDAEFTMLLSGLAVVGLSKDHKPSNELEEQRIVAAGGSVQFDRVDGNLATSRALGDFELKSNAAVGQCDQKVSPEAEVRIEARESAVDQLMIVACDGIWDVLSNERACDYALSLVVKGGEEDLGLVCEEILDYCLDLDSRDNMSVVVAAFPGLQMGEGGEGVAPLAAARAVRREAEEEEQKAEEAREAALEAVEKEQAAKTATARVETAQTEMNSALKNFSKQMGVKAPKLGESTVAAPGPVPPPSSAAQLTELRQVFDAIDTDGNGALDKGELAKALAEMDRAKYGTDLDAAMAAMDGDGDGEVSFEEFCQWWEGGGKLTAVESLDLKWAQFGQVCELQ